MSGNLGPITVEVKFKGESYLAEITPTINGRPVALRPEMHQAEAICRIYTSQLQAMLSKQELTAAYSPKYGFLTEATLSGFTFEKGSIAHETGVTKNLWEGFVDSLHAPEPFLRGAPGSTPANTSSELGPGVQTSFENISSYMNLSSYEKKEVHKSALFKTLKEIQGEAVDSYTAAETQYLQRVACKHAISKMEKGKLIGYLHSNLTQPENEDEKFSPREMSSIYAQWRVARGADGLISTSVIQSVSDD